MLLKLSISVPRLGSPIPENDGKIVFDHLRRLLSPLRLFSNCQFQSFNNQL